MRRYWTLAVQTEVKTNNLLFMGKSGKQTNAVNRQKTGRERESTKISQGKGDQNKARTAVVVRLPHDLTRRATEVGPEERCFLHEDVSRWLIPRKFGEDCAALRPTIVAKLVNRAPRLLVIIFRISTSHTTIMMHDHRWVLIYSLPLINTFDTTYMLSC